MQYRIHHHDHDIWYAIHHHNPRCGSSRGPGSADDKAKGLRGRSQVSNMYWWDIHFSDVIRREKRMEKLGRDAPCVICPPGIWERSALVGLYGTISYLRYNGAILLRALNLMRRFFYYILGSQCSEANTGEMWSLFLVLVRTRSAESLTTYCWSLLIRNYNNQVWM